jgi:hypothetical protein
VSEAGRNARVAIATTLRNAGAVLESFIAYHRAIDFAHLFLFFDDPADPDLPRVRAMKGVTAIAHDAALQEAWRTLPSFGQYGATVSSEVMSRQLLNLEYAMALACQMGFDWLLSIDADELFFAPGESVSEHFAALASTPIETVSYLNYEAIPERDEIGDYFREADLFKLPVEPVRAQAGPALERAVRTFPQLRPKFFHFYNNGKSAVRLSAAGLVPSGVHRFARTSGPVVSARSPRQFVLHYACCGFDAFWTKYATLGRFGDKWWGKHDIALAIGTFHLEARDVVAAGDRDAARAFYRERVAIEDPRQAEELIRLGLATRLTRPREIIEATK